MASILLIEDNEPNRELMTYLLVASGHQVTPANTGEDGVTLAGLGVPDLIVLDIQLPDMSGYQVLDRLRADEKTARVPVVAVTANAMVGDRDHALAAGFNGYLPKPIEPANFASAIDVYLPVEQRGHTPTRQWTRHG